MDVQSAEDCRRLVAAAVDVADDVEGTAVAAAVTGQRRALNDCRRNGHVGLEHISPCGADAVLARAGRFAG